MSATTSRPSPVPLILLGLVTSLFMVVWSHDRPTIPMGMSCPVAVVGDVPDGLTMVAEAPDAPGEGVALVPGKVAASS